MNSLLTRRAFAYGVRCKNSITTTKSHKLPFHHHINHQYQYQTFYIKKCRFSSNSDRELNVTRLSGDDDGIVILSMNRTKVKNALGKQLINEFGETISNIKNDINTRVVIIESTVENVFCAGADLKEREKMTKDEASQFVKLLRKTFTDIQVTYANTVHSAVVTLVILFASCHFRIWF